MILDLALSSINSCTGKSICLGDRGLDDKHMPAIVAALNKKPNIKHVDFSINNLGDDCIIDLCQLKHVTSLDLSRNNVNKGVLDLVMKFNYLNLDQNNISKTSAEKILDAVAIQCSYLNLNRNSLNAKLLSAINTKIQTSQDNDEEESSSCCRCT